MSEVAFDLEVSDQTIYSWLRQDRIDRGLEPGLTTPERAELRAAKRRIADLEAELAIHRRASEPFPVADGWLVRGDTPTAGR